MDKNNPLYKEQGIHVITALFTVDKGKFKVLLIQRKNQPFKDKWILLGGACYNNETVEEGMRREIYEKTGLTDLKTTFFNVFSDPKRSPIMRMLAVVYIGVIDINKVKVLKETEKTKDADWFEIDDVPELGYDHEVILKAAIEHLREKMFETDILENLFPQEFSLPDLHNAYCSILNRNIDRRNFRKKMLTEGIIEDTGFYSEANGKKPAKLYRFSKNKKDKIVF